MLDGKYFHLNAGAGEGLVQLHTLWAEGANFPAYDTTKGLLYFHIMNVNLAS